MAWSWQRRIPGGCTLLLCFAAAAQAQAAVGLPDPSHAEGFLVRLLINEAPFPGEPGYVSEADTRAAMEAVMVVVVNRAHRVPPPYPRKAVAATDSTDLIDIVTAGGERGQVDGFYRDSNGLLRTVPRVEARVNYLLAIANKGQPGAFARLLRHAETTVEKTRADHGVLPDPYEQLRVVGQIPASGYGFAWMSDRDHFHPGGNFLLIPNQNRGSLGGNRFFTLRRTPL